MAFDLYLAGGVSKKFEERLNKLNVCRLLSYYRDKSAIKHWKEAGYKNKLFIDSGAFTAWTCKVQINVDDYIKYLNEHDELFTLMAQLDWIPGTPGISATVEQKIEGAEKTWENFLYMRKHVNSPDKLVYVFHVGENFDFLKNALNYVDEKGPIKALALGGLVDKPMTVKKEFISRCFQIIEKSSHKPSVHGFGLNTFSLLYKYPFTSADATSWVRTAGLGSIMGPNGYIGISDRRSVLPNHYDNLEPEQVQEFLKFIESYGANVDDLKKDPNARAYFNACFIKRWCDNYKRQHEVSYLSSLF